jgi:hypothetical protein
VALEVKQVVQTWATEYLPHIFANTPRLLPGFARFFLVQHTKTGKILPKWPQILPNGQKIYEMAVK